MRADAENEQDEITHPEGLERQSRKQSHAISRVDRSFARDLCLLLLPRGSVSPALPAAVLCLRPPSSSLGPRFAAAAEIARVAVDSSFIASIGWGVAEVEGEGKVSIFVIEMKSGKAYAYPNTPRAIYRAVKAASSIGAAYNAQVKRPGVEAIQIA